MVAKFVLNPAGMAELLRLLPAPTAEAETVADEARRTAPFSDSGTDAEHYRDSITVGEYFDDVSHRNTAYVQASVPWATDVEIRHRTLGRAVGNTGGTG